MPFVSIKTSSAGIFIYTYIRTGVRKDREKRKGVKGGGEKKHERNEWRRKDWRGDRETEDGTTRPGNGPAIQDYERTDRSEGPGSLLNFQYTIPGNQNEPAFERRRGVVTIRSKPQTHGHGRRIRYGTAVTRF